MLRSILICLAAALAGLVSLIVFSTNDAGQQQRGTMVRWSTGGSPPRFALVFTPRAEQRSAKHPLVIAFHGYGDTAAKFARRMHIQTLWPEAIVVYPQGWATSAIQDSAPSSTGWQGKAGEFGDRDLEFFDAIVAMMKRSHAVDKHRIYVTGYSNGADFSLLLLAKRAKTIAAVGEVAGRLDPSETLTWPRPLLAVAGRSDTVAPYTEQKATIQKARQIDRASGAGRPCGRYCTFYPSALGPVPVKTFIHPGGHMYPSWALAEIVRFFKTMISPHEPVS